MSDGTTKAAAGYMHGLDLIRALVAVSVVYTHVTGWFTAFHYPWPVGTVVDATVTVPLRLDAQLINVGFCTFFVISGMVTTRVLDRERPLQFLGRRAARLLPALWVCVLLAFPLAKLGLTVTDPNAGLSDLLANLVLANYFLPGTVTLLDVTWWLTVLIAFYLLVAAMIPLARRWPWLPPAIIATLSLVALSATAADDTPAVHQIRIIAIYLPLLVIGQLISLVQSKRLHPLAGLGLGAAHFLIFVQTWRITDGFGYPRTLVLVLLVIGLFARADGPMVRSAGVRALSQRTYSLYLVHKPVVYPILFLLAPRVGWLVAVVVAMVVLGGATELLHRYVEMPAQRWYRRWEQARIAARRPIVAVDSGGSA